MSLPSLKGRERMTLLSLLTGIKIKENNIPTIQAWESMDFPWDVARAMPSGYPLENLFSLNLAKINHSL